MAKEKTVTEDATSDKYSKLLSFVNKEFGEGALFRGGERVAHKIDVIPSGILGLDIALGVGGYGRGRIIEIYGPEACVAADTFIQYEIRDKNGRTINKKGGSIQRLWERFHGKSSTNDRGKFINANAMGYTFHVASINENERIFKNRIVDVLYKGEKPTFRVHTMSGETILCTEDHKFYTGTGYTALKDLNPGDVVMIHNNTPFTNNTRPDTTCRPYIYVSNHPVAGEKVVRSSISRLDRTIKQAYHYHRLNKARAVLEASMNDLSLDDYINRLNSNDISGLKFLSRNDHVHHLDENVLNNDISNLVVIEAKDHARLHALERHNNLRFNAVEDVIASIEAYATVPVYDLKMESPFNNYVADNFVVHNCGKTQLTLLAIAECQKAGGKACFIDAEHALDPSFAKLNGVNMDELFIAQPDHGEQALEIADTLTKSGLFDLVVIDSVSALVPKAEIEGDMGQAHVGLQARMMSQALRKLTGTASSTKTTIMFINQLRMKIGVMFGNPETTTGGNALKFYASIRLDVRKINTLKDGENVSGHRTRVKIVKNKLSPPFKECEFDNIYGVGVNTVGDVLDLASNFGLVDKSGAWYSMGEERLGQGRDKTIETLKSRPELLSSLCAELKEHLLAK